MSRGPKRNYSDRKISPKVRASEYPYLPEKIEEILDHYHLPVTEIARRTRIPQSSLSRCLNGHSLLSEQSIELLSLKLDDPIPLWWLSSGPEGASLKDVLSKEKAPTPPHEESDPEPTAVEHARLLTEIYEKSEEGDPDAQEWKQIMKRQLILAHKTVFRQKIDVAATKRQSRAVS